MYTVTNEEGKHLQEHISIDHAANRSMSDRWCAVNVPHCSSASDFSPPNRRRSLASRSMMSRAKSPM